MCGELSRRRPVPSSPRTGLGRSKTMAHITEEHLHHMAKRHHATMQKLDGLRERISHDTRKSFGAIETGFGSFAGGLLEGRTQNMPGLGRLPVNLILGAGLLAAGYANVGGERYSSHWNNLGNGFIGSYLASAGYSFPASAGQTRGRSSVAEPAIRCWIRTGTAGRRVPQLLRPRRLQHLRRPRWAGSGQPIFSARCASRPVPISPWLGPQAIRRAPCLETARVFSESTFSQSKDTANGKHHGRAPPPYGASSPRDDAEAEGINEKISGYAQKTFVPRDRVRPLGRRRDQGRTRGMPVWSLPVNLILGAGLPAAG